MKKQGWLQNPASLSPTCSSGKIEEITKKFKAWGGPTAIKRARGRVCAHMHCPSSFLLASQLLPILGPQPSPITRGLFFLGIANAPKINAPQLAVAPNNGKT